jgi:hypothetical protein
MWAHEIFILFNAALYSAGKAKFLILLILISE